MRWGALVSRRRAVGQAAKMPSPRSIADDVSCCGAAAAIAVVAVAAAAVAVAAAVVVGGGGGDGDGDGGGDKRRACLDPIMP